MKAKRNWIQGAVKHPGALRESLGVQKGKKIPASMLKEAADSPNPVMKKRANLAMTFKKMRKS